MQASLDCAYESFKRFDENRDVWTTIRDHCKGLLSDDDYGRYHDEDDCLREWKEFLDKCDPYGEDKGSSDYDDQVNLCDDIENEAKVMRERVIAHDQIKAFTLFLEDKADLSAAYHEFLVSI